MDMDLTGVKCAVCFADVDRDWDVIADQIVCVKCTHEWTDEELDFKNNVRGTDHKNNDAVTAYRSGVTNP